MKFAPFSPNGFPSRNHKTGHSGLAEIVSYIARDNPGAATAPGNDLLDAALSLAVTPFKGNPYPKALWHRQTHTTPVQDFLSSAGITEAGRSSPLLALGTIRTQALSRYWSLAARAVSRLQSGSDWSLTNSYFRAFFLREPYLTERRSALATAS